MNVAVTYNFEKELNFYDFLSKFSRFFSFKFSLSRFITRKIISALNKELSHLYITLLGLKEFYKSYSPEKSRAELSKTTFLLNKLLKIQSRFETINYFDNTEVKENIFACIKEIYRIERLLKKQAKPTFEHLQTEQYIKQQMSEISFAALQKVSL